jgi:ATP-dependent helicase Lhr and Lhr-like helicase
MSVEIFHPLIQRWFDSKFKTPTNIQSKAWPAIANREHVLITAPTGSGKTLTAFLWSINRFITGELATGRTRVLYISPLKALNNDIQRNLIAPLEELQSLFADEGVEYPSIRIQTRSGDTDSSARSRMLRHPPEILITTPESLNLLLSSKGGQGLLHSIDTVILDEIHGVAESKRGVYLMTAVERLVPFSGEFQRIALSATINPLEKVAQLVGGFERLDHEFRARDVSILSSEDEKTYDICVRYPEESAARPVDEKVWDSLALDFYQKILKNKSTLLFVNSRALCEKLTYKINSAASRTIAYAHHGSLSREIRSDVEKRLKEGSLSAIVATSTLEMGIDIGSLDEVILVQSPGSIASSIQRIGRAGHGVGETSKGTIYPTHPYDFLEAAVLSKAVLERDIEPIELISCPLDVLAQIIISMTGTSIWDIDELFQELHRSDPFNSLTQLQFDLVINMLAGRYADNHIRELKPRVNVDRLDNTIAARKGALMSLYLSGGVIPDRGYFQLRHQDNNARIGELDEEFVWEANVGKVFTFGTQHWQVKKITHNDVIVGPGKSGTIAPPFWKSESLSRNFHYAERIGNFLEYADGNLDNCNFKQVLCDEYQVETGVANEIYSFLQRQKDHCRSNLPHRHHLVIEKIAMGPGKASGHQIVLHTGWGAMVNRPFAMALEAAWQLKFGEHPEVFATNESLALQLPHEMSADELLNLVTAEDVEKLLRLRLEGSGFFGARFRENAGRALLLSKGRFNERKPLWMSRIQSQKLMDSVFKYEDFPILLETWRTCLKDEFDLPNLKKLLTEIANNHIKVTEVATPAPSPFAQTVAWSQINTYMYMDDQPKSSKVSNLKPSLLEEVVFNSGLRPRLPVSLCLNFQARQLRLIEGYYPADETELVEWVKERSIIPSGEWSDLVNHGTFNEALLREKIVTISPRDRTLIIALEDKERIEQALAGRSEESAADLEVLIGNYLQYYGPVSLSNLTTNLPLLEDELLPVLHQLEEDQTLVTGPLLENDDQTYWCDSRNYEFLLRLLRDESRVEFSPLPLTSLTPFLYTWQARTSGDDNLEHLFDTIENLRYYPANAQMWESEILPARFQTYSTRDLDQLFLEGDIQWIGTGNKQTVFCFADEEELCFKAPEEAKDSILNELTGRRTFTELLDSTGANASVLAEKLWTEVWNSTISNDSIGVLRKAIETDFKVPDAVSLQQSSQRKLRRGGFNQWRSSVPFAGNWYQINYRDTDEADLLELEEMNKERARTVLERYGIVFRELLLRELPALRWSPLFRSLRLMELSGEVLSGYFFENVPGPQFITPAGLRLLKGGIDEDQIFWINATDPISPAGMGLISELPRRVASNHLVYQGSELVLSSERYGKSITIHVTPAAENLHRYFDVFRHLLYRSYQPRTKLEIETINDNPARQSPYLSALESSFDLVHDHKSVYMQRQFQQ